METTGEPLRIHTSETCRALLQQIGGYQLEERGNIEVGAVNFAKYLQNLKKAHEIGTLSHNVNH